MAIPRLTGDDIEEMRRLCDQMRKLTAHGERREYLNLNRQFHFIAFRRAGSDRLLRFLTYLWDVAAPYTFTGLVDTEKAHQDHERMMDLFRGARRGRDRRDDDAAPRSRGRGRRPLGGSSSAPERGFQLFSASARPHGRPVLHSLHCLPAKASPRSCPQPVDRFPRLVHRLPGLVHMAIHRRAEVPCSFLGSACDTDMRRAGAQVGVGVRGARRGGGHYEQSRRHRDRCGGSAPPQGRRGRHPLADEERAHPVAGAGQHRLRRRRVRAADGPAGRPGDDRRDGDPGRLGRSRDRHPRRERVARARHARRVRQRPDRLLPDRVRLAGRATPRPARAGSRSGTCPPTCSTGPGWRCGTTPRGCVSPPTRRSARPARAARRCSAASPGAAPWQDAFSA